MLLKGKNTKEEFSVTIPVASASVIALEGHGLNDRCPTYSIFSECVAALGGAFGSVVITFDGDTAISAVMAIARDDEILTWLSGDLVELVAFALHVQLPIYINVSGGSKTGSTSFQDRNTPIPIVFEDALSDILRSKPHSAHDASEGEGSDR